MNYPADYDMPNFPAGKKIFSARLAGIVVMILFLMIFFALGLLFWAQKSVQVQPFLVSINSLTGQWKTIDNNDEKSINITVAQSMQESVLTKFVQYWFWVSDSDIVNSARWRECDRKIDCGLEVEKKGIDIEGDCAIYCLVGNDLYKKFVENVLPTYQSVILNNNVWQTDLHSLILTPIGNINNAGGIWQVQFTVLQNGQKPLRILGYANVANNYDAYQKTLGYHVTKFNAYKIN